MQYHVVILGETERWFRDMTGHVRLVTSPSTPAGVESVRIVNTKGVELWMSILDQWMNVDEDMILVITGGTESLYLMQQAAESTARVFIVYTEDVVDRVMDEIKRIPNVVGCCHVRSSYRRLSMLMSSKGLGVPIKS